MRVSVPAEGPRAEESSDGAPAEKQSDCRVPIKEEVAMADPVPQVNVHQQLDDADINADLSAYDIMKTPAPAGCHDRHDNLKMEITPAMNDDSPDCEARWLPRDTAVPMNTPSNGIEITESPRVGLSIANLMREANTPRTSEVATNAGASQDAQAPSSAAPVYTPTAIFPDHSLFSMPSPSNREPDVRALSGRQQMIGSAANDVDIESGTERAPADPTLCADEEQGAKEEDVEVHLFRI